GPATIHELVSVVVLCCSPAEISDQVALGGHREPTQTRAFRVVRVLMRKAQDAVRTHRYDVPSRVDMEKGASQVGWSVHEEEYLVADIRRFGVAGVGLAELGVPNLEG